MKFKVIMGASATNKLMSRYLRQLDAAVIPHQVYHIDVKFPSDGTVKFGLDLWRRIAEDNGNYDRLVLTDAWDVLCYASKEHIEHTLSQFPDTVVFAAERNCHPEPDLAPSIPDRGPWRFVNGGMLTASPKALLEWCDSVRRHEQYVADMIGQQWFNRRLAEHDPLIEIDWETRLFYCMYREEGELVVADGAPVNSIYGTTPAFIHFNGSWPHEATVEMLEGAVAK